MQPFIGIMLGFVLVLTRISAFFVVLPIFGSEGIPVRIKVVVMLLLAVFFSTITAPPANAENITALQAGLLVAGEAIYGLALGVIANCLFSVVRLAGRIIEQQMGLDTAQIMDPLTGESADPLSVLLEMLFVLLFLAANGHHLLLMVISRSFHAFAPGTTPTLPVMVEAVAKSGSVMFIAALRLAAPMLAASLLMIIIIAVLAKIVPEMDIFFFSFPVRIGAGLLITAFFFPLIGSFVAEFAGWMGKLLPL
jgi:flagellar biosynthesis protein FliR